MTRPADLICLSHLRWDFVYQRPNHLMSRAARERRVFFVEEASRDGGEAGLDITPIGEPDPHGDGARGLWRVVPRVAPSLPPERTAAEVTRLVDELVGAHELERYILWLYTPMALQFVRHLRPELVVFDCMDDLASFAGAPPELRELERELLDVADLVFTGGYSLYEAKRDHHPEVYPFPSSVDVAHFTRAREQQPDPADQASIPRPRVGYAGVIDERLDLPLLAELAEALPSASFVLLGPVAKIDPSELPRAPNLHYLGMKRYGDLPAYLSGWDVAMMPFALNDATRFISPTKTPEYLAAGLPVVSTPIRDVVRPYGQLGLVSTASGAQELAAAIQAAFEGGAPHRETTDRLLARSSWDDTWRAMAVLIEERLQVRSPLQARGTTTDVSDEEGEPCSIT